MPVLFSGYLQFKDNFVHGQNNSKFRDWALLKSLDHFRESSHRINDTKRVRNLSTTLVIVYFSNWCRRIFGAWVHMLVSGRHFGLWRVGARDKLTGHPQPPLPQPFTGQASNYNPRWPHRKPGLSSVPFQNNACTAGYKLVSFCHLRSGVLSSSSLQSTGAPWDISNSTTSRCPQPAARCKGVCWP